MRPKPLYEVSIKIEKDAAPGQPAMKSSSAAWEEAGRDVAGIIQGFKLLKYNSHEQVGIDNIENPTSKAGLIQGAFADYHGDSQKVIKIKLGEDRREVAIPVSSYNLKQIRRTLEAANVSSGNAEALLEKIESGLEKISRGESITAAQPQAQHR